MGQGFELTGLWGTIVLGLPLLLLLLVILGGTRARRRRLRPARHALTEQGVPSAADAAPPPAPPPEVAAPQAAVAAPAEVEVEAEEAPPAPPPPPDPVEIAKERLVRLADEIAAAVATGRDRDLPALRIEEARALATTGDVAAAADRLRTAILASARLGMKLEHARARLELGDLAAAAGDLTTACEHWSIARGLVHELKREDGIKAAEARIRDNGCPTDWVLNDF